jgi:hypothetical protein
MSEGGEWTGIGKQREAEGEAGDSGGPAQRDVERQRGGDEDEVERIEQELDEED